jgi:hypothetical protein
MRTSERDDTIGAIGAEKERGEVASDSMGPDKCARSEKRLEIC